MKLAFVVDDTIDNTDGVQQYVLSLGKWFSEQGHEVHYLVGNSKRQDIANVHSLSKNIKVRFNQNRMSTPLPANKKHIKELLSREKFDVLHVQLPYSPWLSGRVIDAAPRHCAIIGTFHILPATRFETMTTRLLKPFIGQSLKRFDRIFSVSEPARVFATKIFGIKSSVLPNVIDLKRFQGGQPLKKYTDKTNIVFLSRLMKRKGCLYLLMALKRLKDTGDISNLRVIICGKGPLEAKLKQYVRSNRLEDAVVFAGFVSEESKPDYLATAQIAVFPSTGGESFGIVLAEAMAAGSEVVIGGDNAGYRAVLGNRDNQLVDPKDIGAFAELLDRYIHRAADRRACQKWQNTAIKQFDVAMVGKKLLNHYEETIAKKRKSKDNN